MCDSSAVVAENRSARENSLEVKQNGLTSDMFSRQLLHIDDSIYRAVTYRVCVVSLSYI